MKSTIKTYAPLAILLLLALVFTFGAFAATYYVSLEGDDTADGSEGTPWKNPNYAASQLAVGDIVRFKGYTRAVQGAYTGTFTIKKSNTVYTWYTSGVQARWSTSTGKQTFTTYGNVSSVTISHLYFKAKYRASQDHFDQQGNQWWGNNDPTHGQNRWHFIDNYFEGMLNLMGSYNIVEQCTFNGRGIHATAIYDSFGSSHHNTYQDNEIYNYTGRGIHSMSYTANHIALRNHIYGFTGTGLAGIDWDGAGHPVYTHSATFNNISGTGGRGIENENCLSGCVTANNKISKATYLMSFINYTTSDGDYRKYTNDNAAIFRNNILNNATEACIRVSASSGVSIDNNTCIGQSGSSYWGGLAIIKVGAWYSQNVAARNNIFIDIAAYPLWVEWTDLNLPGLDLSNNIYLKTNGSTTIVNANGIGTYTLANYATAAGQEAGSLNANPRLSVFKPLSTSIAVGAGRTLAAVTDDYLENVRPYGVGYDIGAYEIRPPIITSFTPDFGNVGTEVTVTGTGFTGTTSVKVNGTAATGVAVDSDTSLRFTVAADTTTGTFTIWNADGSATSVTEYQVGPATPTDIALSAAAIDENAVAGTAVGNLSSTDPDVGDTFTYTLVSGTGDTDNALFAIDGAALESAGALNHEAAATRSVRIRTTDQTNLYYEEAFTITVNDVNEAPTDIASTSTLIPERIAIGTKVGSLTRTDADDGDTVEYSLVAGDGDTDNASFEVSGTDLITAAALNYVTQQTASIRLRATDSGAATYDEVFTITVMQGRKNKGFTFGVFGLH